MDISLNQQHFLLYWRLYYFSLLFKLIFCFGVYDYRLLACVCFAEFTFELDFEFCVWLWFWLIDDVDIEVGDYPPLF